MYQNIIHPKLDRNDVIEAISYTHIVCRALVHLIVLDTMRSEQLTLN